MSTKPIHLMAVFSVPEGKSVFHGLLSELKDLFLAESQDLDSVGVAYNKRTAIQQIARAAGVLLIDVTLLGLRSIDMGQGDRQRALDLSSTP